MGKSCWRARQTKSQVLNLEVAYHVTLAAKAILHVKFKLQTKRVKLDDECSQLRMRSQCNLNKENRSIVPSGCKEPSELGLL